MISNGEGPGPPADEVDWDALARYLAGESTAGEAAAMRRWLQARPDRAALIGALDRSLGQLRSAPPGVDVEAALRRVHARMAQPAVVAPPERPAAPGPARRAASSTWWPAIGVAAAATILATGVLVWRARRDDARGAAARTVATAAGQLDSLRLADGSRVLLGPGSRLTIAEGYGVMHREVELAGEAHFDVAHGGARAFTVRARGATVRDVGTAFAVRSDSAIGVRVAVTAGSVMLRSGAPRDSALLREGDVGIVTPDGRLRADRGGAPGDELAWTEGRLVFHEAPLTEVAVELRRWYGIQLRIADSTLAARHLTASFAGEPPATVLDVIALTLGASLERRGDTATLRAAPAAPVTRPRSSPR